MDGIEPIRARMDRRWRARAGVAVALLIGLASPPPAGAAPGPLRPDPGFGTGGVVTAHPRSIIGPNVVTVDSRGRILVAGLNGSSAGEKGTAVLRLLPDGRRDRSFGRAGTAYLEGSAYDTGLVADRDGGIYLLTSGSEEEELLEHVGSDGVPERRFGTGGAVQLPLSYETAPNANLSHPLVGLPGGGLIVAGRGGTLAERFNYRGPLELRRYSPEGHLVPAFGRDGIVALSDPRLRRFRMKDIAVGADGALLVSGAIPTPAAGLLPGSDLTRERRLAVARLLPDGRLDRSFGDRGIAMPRIPGDSTGRLVLGEPDGDLVVAAVVERPNPRAPEYLYRRPLLLRLDADGSVARRFPEVPPSSYESGYEAGLLASNMSNLAIASGHVFAAGDDGEVGPGSILAYSLGGHPEGYLKLSGRGFENIAGLATRGRELIVLAQRTLDPTKSPRGFVLRAFRVRR